MIDNLEPGSSLCIRKREFLFTGFITDNSKQGKFALRLVSTKFHASLSAKTLLKNEINR
jgi:hypothetical protein